MTDTSQQFRVVLRGYEPAQVDKRIHELGEQVDEARQYAQQAADRVRVLEDQQAAGAVEQAPPAPATFEHLGERVGKILTLAEAEAKDLVDRARIALEDERAGVADEVSLQRSDADRYAEQRRSDADTEAARVLEDARRTADDRLDAAE